MEKALNDSNFNGVAEANKLGADVSEFLTTYWNFINDAIAHAPERDSELNETIAKRLLSYPENAPIKIPQEAIKKWVQPFFDAVAMNMDDYISTSDNPAMDAVNKAFAKAFEDIADPSSSDFWKKFYADSESAGMFMGLIKKALLGGADAGEIEKLASEMLRA